MKVMFVPDYRRGNSYQANLAHSLSKQGVSIYFSPKFHPRRITSLFAMIIGLSRCWRPDILHIHWPDPFMVANNKFVTTIKSTGFICELLLLKLFGVKIVWTVHNIMGHEDRSEYQSLFTRVMVRLTNKLISHCPSANVEIVKTYGKDLSITVVQHGNYIRQYKNEMTSLQARNKLGLDKEDIIFLHFGYIRPYKGISELIDAFKMLDNQRAKLLIVGKPFDDKVVTDMYNDCRCDSRIRNILEFIPDDDIQIYMNAADVVVLPYKDVLTSGTVILSMSFGRPIVAPAIGCIADTIDKKGGFLYNTGDNKENDLLLAMKNVLCTDREVLMNMGKHNFKLAEQFGWDEIGKRTYNVYQECLDGR